MPDTVAVTLPAMGESVTEGTVVEWRKQAGDSVAEGEIVADVSTDKVDVEVPAPTSGVLSRIVVEAGATAPVGAVLAEIASGPAPPGATGDGAVRAASPPRGEAAGGDGQVQPAAPPEPAAAPAAEPAAGPAVPEPSGAPQIEATEPEPAGTAVVELTLPAMGESVTEGTVTRWLKQVGDPVTADETVVEVSTDKVDVEVPAPAAGVLTEVRAAEGDTVAVGAVLGLIAAGATVPATAPADQLRPTAAPPQPRPAAEASSRPASPTLGEPAPAPGPAVRVSPLALRAAAIAGLDVATLRAGGAGGMVRRADVAAALEQPAAPAAAASAPSAGATALRGPAAALAAVMEQSRDIPTATSFRIIEVDTLEARRRELNAAIRAAGRPERVSFTHLIGFAIVRAARELPVMTAYFERTADGAAHRIASGIHLGLAVDTVRKDGSRFLVVPVIRDAAQRDFANFRDEYERLVARARTNSLNIDELQGATLTLTNPGGLGTVASVPRLMPRQGCIVATGAIDYPAGMRALPPARLHDLGVARVMTMTSTYDHRVIQGAESGEFLRRIEQLLAGADGFYADIFGALGLGAPAVVPPSAAALAPRGEALPAGVADHELLAAVSAGMSLVKAFRHFGHLGANLDPLGTEPSGDPSMDPDRLGLTPALMRAVPADVLRVYVPGDTLADVYPRLHDTYCGTIAYQIEHLSSHEQRVWLREYIESGRHRAPLSVERKLQLLGRLTKVDAMERYLRRAFIGQKTFSIEGLDAMVPMLEELIGLVAQDGIGQVLMGMAHRGRLATITHVANKTYESILVAFEQGEQKRRLGEDTEDPTGDVKYHLGALGTYLTDSGKAVTIRLLNNPSHLEAVDPVVEGWTRAEQTRRTSSEPIRDLKMALPVLIHGDAAFPGQGVVAEVLNLQSLPGYDTGGTVHVIANNQVGFTTEPSDARSTRYASDLAKGFDIPIVHVNADDIEACIDAMRLAYEYRRTYQRDVLIDLVGYRRFGHNETDEPSYTQPLMYERIRGHATARELFVRRLVEEGLITADAAEELSQEALRRVQQAHQRVKQSLAGGDEERAEYAQGGDTADFELATGMAGASLVRLNEELLTFPEGFTVNPKLERQVERRRLAVRQGEVDWPTAEALGFASLVTTGHPLRLTGQDTVRGTFSQRHLEFFDMRTGAGYAPIQHLAAASAPFELHNSPLSEEAAVGFEYGYSAAAPDTLVIWEAQFGDFVNGAQTVVDQFVSSGAAKWGMRSRLVLLLPHGYEGMGPEHSSARLERFLQLSANGNMRVASPTTAAQYFHLLRMQALSPHPRPLVVMTPKSLLRSRDAASPLDELATGRFHAVLDDPAVDSKERREQVRTLLLCTGKMYFNLTQSPLRAQAQRTAVVRVEMLDPLPLREILAVAATYPRLEQLFWVQEEPKNMGAWGHLARPIGRFRPYDIRWDYIGRPRRASPSEGFHGAHVAEQERIVREALTIEQTSKEEALNAARAGSQS